ncbi:MAG: hypothetical protein ACNI26_09420 [Terasakiella sp.]|uniref:hypothetical protein n=1 Tax=unclassified Terasakiella TaxID=2614952 RepID=UPI003B002EA0
MKRHDIVFLLSIAFVAVFFGYQLASTLGGTEDNVRQQPIKGWEAFNDKVQAQSITDDDLYLIARQWEWSPTLELKAGKTYLLHVASEDIQHAFHLEKGATGQSIDVLLQPGIEYLIPLKIEQEGQYAIGCTQYCGIEHNKMRSYIVVRK